MAAITSVSMSERLGFVRLFICAIVGNVLMEGLWRERWEYKLDERICLGVKLRHYGPRGSASTNASGAPQISFVPVRCRYIPISQHERGIFIRKRLSFSQPIDATLLDCPIIHHCGRAHTESSCVHMRIILCKFIHS